MSVSTKGPWRPVRDLPYEMNQSGMVRSTKQHKKGAGIYIKPTTYENATPRYVFRWGMNGNTPFSIMVNNLLKEVWDINRHLTKTEIHYIKKIAEQKNRESSNHKKQRPPKDKRITEKDEPLVVNNKYRYCHYCGHILYKSDGNYFYHRSCYRSRDDDIVENLLTGGHSFE